MRVAIVHPWFLARGGAEHVVEVLANLYPSADVFTLFFNENTLPDCLRGRNIQALSLNWLPAKYKLYRAMLPFYPLMFESIDLRGYDLVISSDSCVAKGILVDQKALHICYCHSPMRCLWDLHRDFRSSLPKIARPIFTLSTHYVRQWDLNAAGRVDEFIANSWNVAARISKFYHRQSTVIYPPVDTSQAHTSDHAGDYYLSVGRLTDSKKIDLLIQACNQLSLRLIVAGVGREIGHLKAMAGPTIEFPGRVSSAQLRILYANCRAFLFASDEDFGITPVEAQAHGRPVIAYGNGGALETIIPLGNASGLTPTGVLFPEQTVASLKSGIRSFEENEHLFTSISACRNARRFDTSIFVEQMAEFIAQAYARFVSARTSRDRHFSPLHSQVSAFVDNSAVALANKRAAGHSRAL